MKVYAVLFLFFGVYLSICIWIFLIITDSLRKLSLHGFFRTNRDFVEAVDRQLSKLAGNEPVTEEEIVQLCSRMKNKKMRRYFLKQFIYFADRIKDKNKIRQYFGYALPYVMETTQCDRKMHYSEKSYRLMLLGEFRQDKKEINEVILRALDNESFDVRTNALRALSLIGNPDSFNTGLVKACSGQKYFNIRHITEMIESFEGDKDQLRQKLMDCFYDNPDTYRYQVLVFLAASKSFSSMDFILEYMQNHPENKDNIIACLRFFTVCETDDRARKQIFKVLQEDDVEYRAIAVKLAPKYFQSDREVIRLLLGEGYLKSRDWYVRRNSASALVSMGMEKAEIINELPTDDNYAREALIYAMFDAGMTTYQEFVELGGAVNV